MPRYFFHVTHAEQHRDDDGLELPHFDAAWAEAVTACGEMMRDMNGLLRAQPEWSMDCHDEGGARLFCIRFSAEKFV